MTPLESAWQTVLCAPDDDHALQVLSDALMERGDVLGELIRLQLSGEPTEDHLTQHAAELLGDPLRLTTWSPRLARGFLESIQIASAAELDAAFARPIGRLLRQIHVTTLTAEPIDRIAEVIATRAPQTLTTLRFGGEGLRVDLEHPGVLHLAPITSSRKALHSLTTATWPARFEGTSSQSLRELSIDMLSPVSGLDQARFPHLQRLTLHLPFRRFDLPLALLAGEVAPRLESLTITGALWPQQLSDLSVSALLRGLDRLELTAEAETGWYTTLLETIEAWAHLEHLVLTADRHHPEWVQAVKAALPQAVVRDPRLRL